MTGREPRSLAEWVSLGVSAAVVLAVVALILAQVPGEDEPAAPAARIDEVREVEGSYHVEVMVENLGHAAATQVQVVAELTTPEATYTGDQTVEILSGGAERSLVFVFTEDPSSGDLRVDVSGFATP